MAEDKVEMTVVTKGEKTHLTGSGEPVRERTLSLLGAVVLVVNTIIGSGIFASVPATFTVFHQPSIGMVVVFWVVGGLFSAIGALCYAELGCRIPASGGESLYYSKVFTPKLSPVFDIMFLLVVKGMTLSALGHTCATYVVDAAIPLHKHGNTIKILVAISSLVLFFTLNCLSKHLANKVSIFFTACKLLALSIIIGCGIYSLCTKNIPEWQSPFNVQQFDVNNLCLAVSSVFWACEGWTCLGAVTGEMKNPTKDFLKAIVIGMSIVTISYVLAIVSYSAVIGYDQVRTTSKVALDVATVMLGKYFPIIPVLIATSAMGTENGTFFYVSTALVSAGYRNEIPKIFSLVHRTKRTGVFSLFVLLLISIGFVFTSFDDLIKYCGFISWTFYFLSFCALEKLKLSPKQCYTGKIFKIYVVFPVIMRYVCIFMIAISFTSFPIPCYIISGIMIMIGAVQFLPVRFYQPKCVVHLLDATSRRIQLWFNLVEASSTDVS